MKKYILILLFALIPFVANSESYQWTEVQVVVVPRGTPLYTYKSATGTIKYYFKINGIKVPVSANNAERYFHHEIQLEIVKWYNSVTNKYRYTTRKHNESTVDIDLEQYFKKE